MAAEISARGERASRKRGAYWFYGDLVTVHISGEETEGRFSLLEWIQPPGEATPVHVHKHSDQTTYVLEGELTLHLPGETLVAGHGECVHGPMGVPHAEEVTSAGPARLVEVNSPAGFEDFVAALGQPASELALPNPPLPLPDVQELIAVAAEHDIEVLGPPGSRP